MKRYNLNLDEKSVDELKRMPGTLSEHIRKSLVDYIEKHRNVSVSESKIQKGGDTHE